MGMPSLSNLQAGPPRMTYKPKRQALEELKKAGVAKDKIADIFAGMLGERIREIEADGICERLGHANIKAYGDEIAMRGGDRYAVDGVRSPFAKLEPVQIGQYSPLFFGTYYLDGFEYTEHQANWVDSWKYKRIIHLAPRDHGKTFLFLLLRGMWSICYIPNVTILFVSRKIGQCQKPFLRIRRELEFNDKVIHDFGQLKMPGGRWSDTLIDCVRRGKSIDMDPTLECVGVEGSITGAHPKIICADDIENEGSVKTASRMIATKNWWDNEIMELCEPDTVVSVSGTRKHMADLYHFLLDSKLWKHKIDRAIVKFPKNWENRIHYVEDEEGTITGVEFDGDWAEWQVLWPEKWGPVELLLDRYDNPISFDREKQNDPTGITGRGIRPEWIKYFLDEDLPGRASIFLGIDLAISETERADFFVIAVLAVHKRRGYLLEYYRDKIPFPVQISKIKEYIEFWNPNSVGIEDNQYQKAMPQQLKAEGITIVKPVRAKGNKQERLISRLAPLIKNERLQFRGIREAGSVVRHPNMEDAYNEVKFLSNPQHDDILDGVYCAVSVAGFDRGIVSKDQFKVGKVLNRIQASSVRPLARWAAQSRGVGQKSQKSRVNWKDLYKN